MNKLKRSFIVVSLLVVLLVSGGCDTYGQTPRGLVSAAKPVTLISKSSNGVIFKDAEGALYSYDEHYFFARNVISGQMQVGDNLCDFSIEIEKK